MSEQEIGSDSVAFLPSWVTELTVTPSLIRKPTSMPRLSLPSSR